MSSVPGAGSAPYYQPVGNECAQFATAYAQRLPILLKGPTGCGKTRFVEYMAWTLGRSLITVACHDDLTAADLTGRWLLDAGGTRWQDGPLTRAARTGAICYLDELVEARSDTTVVIHPLTDARRMLPLDRCGETITAHPDFLLVISYNPGPGQKELKPATRQRFCGLSFAYPEPAVEAAIIAHEGGITVTLAAQLVAFGQRTRRLVAEGLPEGASTRMLIHAASLIHAGLAIPAAVRMAVVTPLSDDPAVTEALSAAVEAIW